MGLSKADRILRDGLLARGFYRCAECGKLKAISEFHTRSERAYGISSYCKECVTAKGKARYQKRLAESQCKCPRCGKPRLPENKHCSRTCMGKTQGERQRGENNPWWKGGLVSVKCERCDTEFYVRQSRVASARFCGDDCKHAEMRGSKSASWKGGKVEFTCDYCGKILKAWPSQKGKAGGHEHIFCPGKCKAMWQSENCRRENNPNWQGRTVMRGCEICGVEFEAWMCLIEIGWDRFCSNECQAIWQKQSDHNRGANHPNWKGGEVERECRECGTIFKTHPAWIRKGGGRGQFCSPDCSHAFAKRTGQFAGANNPRWIDGRSYEPYTSAWTEEFRDFIRARDQHICALCGEVARPASHAIKPPVHHIDYDKTSTAARNALTLCHSCHTSTNTNRELWQDILAGYMLANYNEDCTVRNDEVIRLAIGSGAVG